MTGGPESVFGMGRITQQISDKPAVAVIRRAAEVHFGDDKATARRVGLYLCHQ